MINISTSSIINISTTPSTTTQHVLNTTTVISQSTTSTITHHALNLSTTVTTSVSKHNDEEALLIGLSVPIGAIILTVFIVLIVRLNTI